MIFSFLLDSFSFYVNFSPKKSLNRTKIQKRIEYFTLFAFFCCFSLFFFVILT